MVDDAAVVSGLYTLQRGDTPLLVHVPHAGTRIPAGLAGRLSGHAETLPDTDWHADRLYGFASALGAGLMVATHSRYVIDLNRPPDDEALYSTRTTGLMPLETFDGEPLYREGAEPRATEARERCRDYWHPHHRALKAELDRLRSRHGHAVLLDAHSIRSEVPALFPGRLPVFNLGSHSGRSADPSLVELAAKVLSGDPRWDLVIDGRFKGGYITRHYGRPADGVHALQLEMAQRAYMDEATRQATEHSMQAVRGMLGKLVSGLSRWRPSA